MLTWEEGNYSFFEVSNEYEVPLFWTEDECTPHDVEYVLTVTNSSSSELYVTNFTSLTLNFSGGVKYTVTVTVQLCKGNVTSDKSNPLTIEFPGM